MIGTNYHCWNWFYYNIQREAKCFNGVVLTFIYCGVIVTDVYGNKRATFVDGDFLALYNSVMDYICANFKRHRVVVHVKKNRR